MSTERPKHNFKQQNFVPPINNSPEKKACLPTCCMNGTKNEQPETQHIIQKPNLNVQITQPLVHRNKSPLHNSKTMPPITESVMKNRKHNLIQ